MELITFIEALQVAGWQPINDAQWERIEVLWKTIWPEQYEIACLKK